MKMDQNAIETEGLTKRYREVEAVSKLDLRVPKHSICAFLGPNGAGKSTTIKMLLGLSRPTAGRGRVLGFDVVRESLEIRRRVGYLPQEPRFYNWMTARETLRFVARFFYRPSPEMEERVEESLELVGLSDKADRPVGGFSGGERQRLGIAQAQINNPDLLILDEPAASLDPVGRRDVLTIMERLRRRTTVFYSTHILDDVQRVSDTVIILKDGRLVAQAPIQELLANGDGAAFVLALKGKVEPVRERLEAQSWVLSVRAGESDGQTTWRVYVSDEEAAEARLLRLVLSDPEVTVTEFGRVRSGLEDVFMQLVGGDQDAR